MTKYINDWGKVVRSLINHLKRNGYQSIVASNGEDSIKLGTPKQFADMICECDEGYLRVIKGDEKYNLFIVLGNSPSELVCDYSWKKGMEDQEKLFSNVLSEWSDKWDLNGNVCPKKELK